MNVLHHIKQYASDAIHLFYPHVCVGCGSDVIETTQTLCAQCFAALPQTDYFLYANNPVERLFAGRIIVQSAGSAFYFTKKSLLQNLLHEIKYKGNKEAGLFVGKQIGIAIQQSNRFEDIDMIVPLPLNSKRLQQRGYNQATLLAKGIASVIEKPVNENIVFRRMNTETQTGKNRADRWQNMQAVFGVKQKEAIEGKHVLLVDDIVTTGATLEACGEAILSIPNTQLSIATAAHTL